MWSLWLLFAVPWSVCDSVKEDSAWVLDLQNEEHSHVLVKRDAQSPAVEQGKLDFIKLRNTCVFFLNNKTSCSIEYGCCKQFKRIWCAL